ncbi:MAG: HAD family hydrolase [Alphaproteobacteria bacterium]|nr:HAD family hydrolase [Alphaproteobacteria bacterium]
MSEKYYIVDLDGTLYYQTPVRVMMLGEILFYLLCHPLRWKEIFVVYKFRQYYDKEQMIDIDTFSQNYNFDKDKVEKIIEEWMIRRPLKWIKFFADRKLISLLKKRKFIVFSDYPTAEKLSALNIKPLGQYFCDNINIKLHKPDPQGLEYICKIHNLTPENICVIGDRFSHDGKCALKFGCEFVILSKNFIRRQFQYRNIK